MEGQQNNRLMIGIIVAVLVVLFAFLAGREYEEEQSPAENIQETMEEAGDKVEEGLEETGDNIEDALDQN